jgi:hypothetical protein
MPGQIKTPEVDYSYMEIWDPDKAPKQIEDLFKKILSFANEKVAWYLRNRIKKGKLSKWLRFFAISLFIISTISPLINMLIKLWCEPFNDWFLYVGYISATFGGGILLFDKFWSASSGWVRLSLTYDDLLKSKNEFETSWNGILLINPPNTLDGFKSLVDNLKNFQDTIFNLVNAETCAWGKEFQANNDDLQKLLKEQASQCNPGDLTIRVTNYNKFSNLKCYNNNVFVGDVIGGTILLSSVPPDNYQIRITGEIKMADGNIKTVEKTDIGVVKPGDSTNILSITLPEN